MAPWTLIAGAAAAVIFPQQRAVIVVVGAVVSLLKSNKGNGDNQNEDKTVEMTGNIKPVRLEWNDVTCTLTDKKGEETRKILNGVSGSATPGRLLAIMGSSGAGKTMLLSTLAGQLPRQKLVRLTGELLANGVNRKDAAVRQAFVRQEDIFFSQLTVRETVLMAAKLQLPPGAPEEEKVAYVDNLIHHLGLANAANTIVGDAKVRGISGGEKRRLSIACELLGSPSVIFCDEPTTGLDAFQAEKVMAALHKLAEEGRTVICSIHQPRSSVYSMFDDILLLTNGKVIYTGPAGDEALSYFEKLGYTCPMHVNPAEFFADLISIDYSSEETEKSSKERIDSLLSSFLSTGNKGIITSTSEDVSTVSGDFMISEENGKKSLIGQKGGAWTQFKLLVKRAWLQTTRDKATNYVRAGVNVFSALLFGSIFWRMGFTQTSIQDRMGLLQVAAINTAMASLTKTISIFPRERIVVDRERSKGAYAVGPYFLGKLLAELPVGALFPLLFGTVVYPMAGLNKSLTRFGKFLGIITLESFASSAFGLTVGALAPNPEAALAMGPSMMTVFIVFGGYYVNEENTPQVFRWIPNVSLIRWAFEGLCVNEFRGLKFEVKKNADAQFGDQVLERLSFQKSSVGRALLKEGQILLWLYWSTFYLLKKKRLDSQPLLPPSLPSSEEEKKDKTASEADEVPVSDVEATTSAT